MDSKLQINAKNSKSKAQHLLLQEGHRIEVAFISSGGPDICPLPILFSLLALDKPPRCLAQTSHCSLLFLQPLVQQAPTLCLVPGQTRNAHLIQSSGLGISLVSCEVFFGIAFLQSGLGAQDLQGPRADQVSKDSWAPVPELPNPSHPGPLPLVGQTVPHQGKGRGE